MRTRPGRPLQSPTPGVFFPGGRDGTNPQRDDWFPVRLTGLAGETADGHPQFVGHEVWNNPRGTTVEAVGKRVLTARQPGVFLGGDPGLTQYDLPALALARLGPGAGGQLWELFGAERVRGSGSGAAVDAGGGCDLETVYLDVVTDVDLAACTVTRKRIAVTGCHLSAVILEPPAAGSGSGSGSGGATFPTDCQGPGESLAAHPGVTLTVTGGPYAGGYPLVWTAAPTLVGGAAWQADFTIGGVPHRLTLFVAGTAGNYSWYAWVTNLNTSETTVLVASSGACEPFALTFPAATLSATSVTAGVT